VHPATVWDIGANTGRFSRLASERGIETISFDKDQSAVEKNYLMCVSNKETKILPLVLDLTNPSPMIGWANNERVGLLERGPADMVFALALIHHLAISQNVPLGMVSDYLAKLCNWLVIEYVPKNDKKVRDLLASREDVFSDYTRECFEREFNLHFNIESVQSIRNSERILYLMKKKAQLCRSLYSSTLYL